MTQISGSPARAVPSPGAALGSGVNDPSKSEASRMIDRTDVQAAAARISDRVRTTALITVDDLLPGAAVWLKLEQSQHTGSFKARGAFNRILATAERGGVPDSGVVAASGGNAGLAVAYAAAQLGIPAEVYVPENAPAVKVAKLRQFGAKVVQVGQRYLDAYEAASQRVAASGALFCHAYDQPEIVAGQGTLGWEIRQQSGDEVDTILVAVGGGGLMAGIAAATEGRAKVVGVEPKAAPTLHEALTAGEPVDVEVSGVAADSLGASRIGEIAFAVAARAGVRSVLVSDDEITQARRELWQRYRLIVEHGTAAAVAALITGAYRPADGERIAIVLCGANTDPSDLG
ncbi:threonine/serine dehydratase [Saccharopolyspora sp. K220]|uniref:threonine/serine dehydratase n=1 Tax=Saccharopolyspora soli TaxID=2926618 RepID=UPI001F57020E|nr:threonine/serine dehydratase [Saccharopolyspora soli]MCI2416452.1 threonine/serine dehydratase [Saccharopolyspora soli]